jgi:hypothetical protein
LAVEFAEGLLLIIERDDDRNFKPAALALLMSFMPLALTPLTFVSLAFVPLAFVSLAFAPLTFTPLTLAPFSLLPLIPVLGLALPGIAELPVSPPIVLPLLGLLLSRLLIRLLGRLLIRLLGRLLIRLLGRLLDIRCNLCGWGRFNLWYLLRLGLRALFLIGHKRP